MHATSKPKRASLASASFGNPMSNRRKRPVNQYGCKPDEDVCVQHDEPLVCEHGCTMARKHPGCVNRYGCLPVNGFCTHHGSKLICQHGCSDGRTHPCWHTREETVPTTSVTNPDDGGCVLRGELRLVDETLRALVQSEVAKLRATIKGTADLTCDPSYAGIIAQYASPAPAKPAPAPGPFDSLSPPKHTCVAAKGSVCCRVCGVEMSYMALVRGRGPAPVPAPAPTPAAKAPAPPKHTCNAGEGSFGCRVCDEMDPRTRRAPVVTVAKKTTLTTLKQGDALAALRDAALDELRDAVWGLNADEQAVVFGVAMDVAERMHKGRSYGPLDLSSDARDFAVEAYEEAIDGSAYGKMYRLRKTRAAAALAKRANAGAKAAATKAKAKKPGKKP